MIQWSHSTPEQATWEDYAVMESKFPSFDPCGQGIKKGRGSVTLLRESAFYGDDCWIKTGEDGRQIEKRGEIRALEGQIGRNGNISLDARVLKLGEDAKGNDGACRSLEPHLAEHVANEETREACCNPNGMSSALNPSVVRPNASGGLMIGQ